MTVAEWTALLAGGAGGAFALAQAVINARNSRKVRVKLGDKEYEASNPSDMKTLLELVPISPSDPAKQSIEQGLLGKDTHAPGSRLQDSGLP